MTKILIGGDVFLGQNIDGIASRFFQLSEFISGAEAVFVNLEGPICEEESGWDNSNSRVRLANHYGSVSVLKEQGVSLISLANNHACDFGFEGIRSTLDSTKGIQAIGLGHNEQGAEKPAYIATKAGRIGFLAFAEDIGSKQNYATGTRAGYSLLETGRVLDAVRTTMRSCDYLIVYMHHGLMRLYQPVPWVRALSHEIAGLGVTLVAGSHAHHYGPVEKVGDTIIAYQLGDLFFNDIVNPHYFYRQYAINRFSLLVELELHGRGLYDWRLIPCLQSRSGAVRAVRNTTLKRKILAEVDRMSSKLHADASYEEYFIWHNSRAPKSFLGRCERGLRELSPMAERLWWACRGYPVNTAVSPGYRKSKIMERLITAIHFTRSSMVQNKRMIARM